jgi:hypothetical protein
MSLDLDPPPSLVELVTENFRADSIWKKWLNNLYEYVNKIMKTGYTSDDNASTTAINTGSNYTGTWENVSGYNSLVVAVATDQDGYFEIRFSPDGTNVDSTLTRYYRTAQIEPPHRFTITRDYFQVRFFNDSGTNQTYFRLQVQIGEKNELNIPLDSVMSQDYDSTSTRPTDFRYEVALNRRQGYTTWNKWGYNSDIDVATSPETVWSAGGLFVQMTTADTLTLVSTSANDADAGTGANSVVITGVDENWDEQILVVTLNGLTPVVTTGFSWLGVNRMAVYVAGSLQYNEGILTAAATTATTTQAHVPATEGSTQQAFLFVPRAHTALLDWLFLNVTKLAGGVKPEIIFRAFVTSSVSNSRYEIFRDIVDVAIENHTHLTPSQPFVVGEKSLIEFQATSDTDNTAASARFSGIIVRDVDA